MAHPRNGRAFTLAELLIVIAIIGLLIAILLPTLIRAREQAQSTQCLANERSIVQAALLQANEHKGFLQPAGDCFLASATPVPMGDPDQQRYAYYTDADGPRPMPFFAACAAQMRVPIDTTSRATLTASLSDPLTFRAFTCPAQQFRMPGISIFDTGWSAPYETVSYLSNEEVLGFRSWSATTPHGHLVQVRNASSVMLLCDGVPRVAADLPGLTVWGVSTTTTLADYAYLDSYYQFNTLDFVRHHGKMNVAFCDGHAETFQMGTANRQLPGTINQVGVSQGIY
jgi:prepilin-type processing-associated H-X9-DG protein/prepilin-type N-terminal cleavage/methylation domain-containing protein